MLLSGTFGPIPGATYSTRRKKPTGPGEETVTQNEFDPIEYVGCDPVYEEVIEEYVDTEELIEESVYDPVEEIIEEPEESVKQETPKKSRKQVFPKVKSVKKKDPVPVDDEDPLGESENKSPAEKERLELNFVTYNVEIIDADANNYVFKPLVTKEKPEPLKHQEDDVLENVELEPLNDGLFRLKPKTES